MASIVTTNELASFLDVHPNTIRQWISDGLPVHYRAKRGEKGGHKFNVRRVVEWLKEKAVHAAVGEDTELITSDEAKRRKLIADAQLQEIELAKKRGEVVDLSEMQRELAAQMIELRASMRRVPERCVLRLVGETNESKIKKVLLSEIDDALVRAIGE